MFGFTQREQRWKAEQKAAEVFVRLAEAAVRAEADARVAEAQANAAETAALRALNSERTKIMEDLKSLRKALTETYPREELDIEALARVVAVFDGLPPGALDGGWTFKGFMAWAQAMEKNAQRYCKLRAGKYSIQVARRILNDTPHGIDAAVDALDN